MFQDRYRCETRLGHVPLAFQCMGLRRTGENGDCLTSWYVNNLVLCHEDDLRAMVRHFEVENQCR